MKSNTFRNELLLLYGNNTDIPNIGDAAGLQNSVAAGSLFAALHTASPGAGGNQGTNEATYTPYARKSIARSGAGFTISDNNMSNAALADFPQCTSGSETLTFWSLGRQSAGATSFEYYAPLIASGAIWLPFTAKVDDTITIPGHTYAVDDRITFRTALSGTLPAGMTAEVVYWIKTVSGDDITVSTTQGGATLNLTTVGSGAGIECSPINVSANIRPEFAIGELDILES